MFHLRQLQQNKSDLHSSARDVIGQIWILDDPIQPSYGIWSLLCRNLRQLGNYALKSGQMRSKGVKANVRLKFKLCGHKGQSQVKIWTYEVKRVETGSSRVKWPNLRQQNQEHLLLKRRDASFCQILHRTFHQIPKVEFILAFELSMNPLIQARLRDLNCSRLFSSSFHGQMWEIKL